MDMFVRSVMSWHHKLLEHDVCRTVGGWLGCKYWIQLPVTLRASLLLDPMKSHHHFFEAMLALSAMLFHVYTAWRLYCRRFSGPVIDAAFLGELSYPDFA
jgi:hypothetical protein